MPLFGRRQSEGNALNQMEKSRSTDGGSGFTVLSQEEVAARKARREAVEAERDRPSRKSFGFSFASKTKNRASIYEEDSGSSNRGSNASSSTNSTHMNLYSTGSSARLSSSSTLPSSVGTEAVDDLYIPRNSNYGLPTVPRPLTHRDRASTLGPAENFSRPYAQRDADLPRLPNATPPPVAPPPPVPEHTIWGRSRATTASSSASTARPPKLDLGLSNFGDFTEDLFGIGAKDSRSEITEEPVDILPPRPPPHTYMPAPPSPYSPKDIDAHAPLLSSSQEKSPAAANFPKQITQKNNASRTTVTQSAARSLSRPISQPALHSVERPTVQPTTQSTAAESVPTPRPSAPRTPASMPSNHRRPSYSVDLKPKSAIPAPFSQDELDNEPLFPSSSKPAFQTPEPPETQEQEDDSPSRMVTTAEYEKMKMLAGQESDQSNNGDDYASDSDGEVSDTERNRKDRWAREKQQGDLAVNRQIYRKTVGGLPEPQPNRFSTQGSAVTATLRESEAEKKQFEHDGDWDVPLAALAAHGFPKTGTPRPSLGHRQSSYGSQSEFRSSGQFVTEAAPPGRPASTMGSVTGQLPRPTSHLPAFARGLPADPHFSGVVPSHPREQLRFNSRSSSVPVLPTLSPSQQNATLMDVIVGEERARATRRGSPSAAGLQGAAHLLQQNVQHPFHDSQRMSMFPQQMPMMQGGFMPQQFPGNANTPEVQMLQQQLQFTQQMMVQMQQHMMQMSMQSSAASMINGQVPQPGYPQPHPMPAQQLPAGQQRPISMAPHMNGMGGVGYQQRPGSTYAPSMYGVTRPNAYAASIAPSERNTMGMSSRYRSVGYANGDSYSTITPVSNSRPVSRGNQIKATLRPAGSRGKLRSPSSDESDEEKYFAEANERAKARRAKTEPNVRELREGFVGAM